MKICPGCDHIDKSDQNELQNMNEEIAWWCQACLQKPITEALNRFEREGRPQRPAGGVART